MVILTAFQSNDGDAADNTNQIFDIFPYNKFRCNGYIQNVQFHRK